MFYSETNSQLRSNIRSLIIDSETPFKELRSLNLLFATIKNPQNLIIVLVDSVKLLKSLQNVCKNCYDYQNRVFVIHSSLSTVDNFFDKYCIYPNLDELKNFLSYHIQTLNISPQHQPSKLLSKLVKLELQNLEISKKYIGFKYLTDIIVNALCNNFYSDSYIELFKYVASINLATIDTIERDVRHMLLTTWKNNAKFRQTLQTSSQHLEKANSKNILNAIITHLKNVI